MNSGDYLYEKKGESDAETRELEALLGGAKFKGMTVPEAAPSPPRRLRTVAPWVGLVALAAAAAVVLLVPRGPFFELTDGAGRAGRLYVSRWFETGASDSAQVRIADIGRLEVRPGSRLRLTRTDAQEHRLELARGSVHAQVNAPPRLFVIDTPSASAIDLGCEYELSVDEQGGSRLEVATGWVELEGHGRRSTVRAGMRCATRPGRGPGTPVLVDAPEAFVAAVERFDATGADLDAVLAQARAQDALSLWHLLERTDGPQREAVFTALNAHVPAPVDRAAVLKLEPRALEAWGAACDTSANHK